MTYEGPTPRGTSHWYVARIYFGEFPIQVWHGGKANPIDLTGAGESPEDAMEDLGVDYDTLEAWKAAAKRRGAQLRIVVVDQFTYEKVLWKPQEG